MSGERPVCLITGGASGIGAACVHRFAAAGYHVVCGDIQTAKGKALARELGEQVLFKRLDVRSEADFAAAADGLMKQFDLKSQQEVRTYSGHTDWIFALDYDPASQRVATGSYNGDGNVLTARSIVVVLK